MIRNPKSAVVYSLKDFDPDSFKDLNENPIFQSLKKAFEKEINILVPGVDQITALQNALYDSGIMTVFKAVEDLAEGVHHNPDSPDEAFEELEPENIPLD